MSLISSLPFCVEEFESMDEVNAKYIIPYFNANGGPNKTGFKGTLFPLALTKEQVHALYWRVKTIDLDYEVTGVGDGRGFSVGAAEVPEDLLGSDIKAAIIKRVCGGLRYLTYEAGYYLPPPASPSTTYSTSFLPLFDFRAFPSGGVTIRTPRCAKIGDAYYPFFEWANSTYGGFATTFGIETYISSTNSGGGTFTSVTTFLGGPTVTLNFPDSSTASFQTFLRRTVQTNGSSTTVYSTGLTVGPWNVNLW